MLVSYLNSVDHFRTDKELGVIKSHALVNYTLSDDNRFIRMLDMQRVYYRAYQIILSCFQTT